MSLDCIRQAFLTAAVVVTTLGLSASAEAQTASETEAFIKETTAKLQEALPQAVFESEPGDPLQINITDHPELGEAVVNLHRVYSFCQMASVDECNAEVARLIYFMKRSSPEFTPSDLRVIVRDAEYWKYVTSTLRGSLPPHRQIGEDLFAILVVDSPQSITLAGTEVLDELGLSAEEAWERGVEQTDTVGSIPQAVDYKGRAFAFSGEEYMGSVLVDIARWSVVSDEVGPDLMIAAVSDQFVFSAVIPDGPNLDGVRQQVAEDCAAAARCISPHIYRFRGGKWVFAD